jgi:uncharacterized protein (TIGR02246 family)
VFPRVFSAETILLARTALIVAMTSIRLFSLAAVAALALAPASLAAQREMYGMSSSGAEGRRQFEIEARQQVSGLLVEYESAWGSDDPRTLMRLYSGSAVLYPVEGGMLTGRDAIRAYYDGLLPNTAPVTTRIVEFKVSGDLAIATVQVTYLLGQGGEQEQRFVGTDVFVLKKGWVSPWSIVSHFRKAEGPPAPADSTGARNAGG